MINPKPTAFLLTSHAPSSTPIASYRLAAGGQRIVAESPTNAALGTPPLAAAGSTAFNTYVRRRVVLGIVEQSV